MWERVREDTLGRCGAVVGCWGGERERKKERNQDKGRELGGAGAS